MPQSLTHLVWVNSFRKGISSSWGWQDISNTNEIKQYLRGAVKRGLRNCSSDSAPRPLCCSMLDIPGQKKSQILLYRAAEAHFIPHVPSSAQQHFYKGRLQFSASILCNTRQSPCPLWLFSSLSRGRSIPQARFLSCTRFLPAFRGIFFRC